MAGTKKTTLKKTVLKRSKKKALVPVSAPELISGKLLTDVRDLIVRSRSRVAYAVNSMRVLMHWEIGRRIRRDLLKSSCAAYGEEIVSTLSTQLVDEFGEGFSKRILFRMMRFAEVFPDRKIVSTLSTQLGWSHFVEIIPLEDALKRHFYAEMCRLERWSVRTLRDKVQSLLFERTAISRKPKKLVAQELALLREHEQLTLDLVFRDPYVLDFLRSKDTCSEHDLESAILREMEHFLLEFGVGFTFMERQKRITIDGDDYYLDLLFYHRRGIEDRQIPSGGQRSNGTLSAMAGST